ncbi:MAG: hypothetical protein ACF8NJ_04905, partial [Phycisphaerales bacterium JB038]
ASSPLAATKKPLKVVTNAEDSSCIDLKSDSGITGGRAYIRPTASATALDVDTAFATVTRQDLPSPLPIVTAPIDYLGTLYAAALLGREYSAVTVTQTGYAKLDWLKLTNGAVLTIQGDQHLGVSDDFNIDNSTLIIDGHVRICVFDNLTLDHGATIELTEGSTLELFVADNIDVKESAIGFSKEILAAGPLPSAALPYADPGDILIVGGHTDPNHVYIDNGSIVRGRLYAQLDDVQIKGASALYGCALGWKVKLDQGSYLHYDHSLDCETGYTVTDGPLYDDVDGQLVDGLATAVANSDFASAKTMVLDANGVTAEAEVAEVAPEITVRKLARCIARPRPTKARKYEGQPLAHAEEDAQ